MAVMRLGRAGSLKPLSDDYGFDRGKPIDRHYIEAFLATHAGDIAGTVLEVAEDSYSRRFGGAAVTCQEILHIDPAHPRATITGDLTDPAVLPGSRFDCIILTQTLHLIFDMAAAMEQLHRALRPGGVLLVTVPGITPVPPGEWSDSWYWSLTAPALAKLLSGPFDPAQVTTRAYGNLHAATAFLHGASVQEVGTGRLAPFDPAYPVTIAARAVR